MQHGSKEYFGKFLQAQEALSRSIIACDSEAIESGLSQVINSAIDLKCTLVSGKRIPMQDAFTIVKYREFSKVNLGLIPLYDIFMSSRQLPMFAYDPIAYLLMNRLLAIVYIFGLNEDFVEHIAPHILSLESCGINMIRYFSLDRNKYTCIDPIDYTHYLINVVSEPTNVRSMKREVANSKVCNISSLSQIRSLANLVNLI